MANRSSGFVVLVRSPSDNPGGKRKRKKCGVTEIVFSEVSKEVKNNYRMVSLMQNIEN